MMLHAVLATHCFVSSLSIILQTFLSDFMKSFSAFIENDFMQYAS